MTVTLDSAFVATSLQALDALAALLDKAEDHCAQQGLAPEALTEARLAPDMWPFAKQVFEAVRHSAGAVAGVRAGVFSPDPSTVPSDFASLRSELAGGAAMLRALVPGELDAIAGQDMRFEASRMQLDFTAEDFLLSFSLPNLFFHTTAAYSILRNQGLPIGKRDYLVGLRIKR